MNEAGEGPSPFQWGSGNARHGGAWVGGCTTERRGSRRAAPRVPIPGVSHELTVTIAQVQAVHAITGPGSADNSY